MRPPQTPGPPRPDYGGPPQPDDFESLRQSEAGAYAAQAATEFDDGTFEVELPDDFISAPSGAAAPRAAAPEPASLSQPVPVIRSGLSAGGVFLIALLTQIFLVSLVGTLAWAFPDHTRTLVHNAAAKLELGSALRASTRPSPGPSSQLAEIQELENRAIFRAERTAWQELNRLSRTLESSTTEYDASNASLIRIRMRYQYGAIEIPPPLDPREFYPTAESEADIPDPEIVRILRDRRLSPDKRRRAAYLLGNNRSGPVSTALYHAIQDDPNLLVVRQAFESFRTITGYPGAGAFDVEAIERWWSRNGGAIAERN